MKNEMDTLPLGRCARLLLGLLIAVASLAAAPADESLEKTAIAKVIDDSIGWFATKDFDRMYAAFADDAEFFIFHPVRSRRFAAPRRSASTANSSTTRIWSTPGTRSAT